MVKQKEYDYVYKKAIAWENECIATKRCLWAIFLEAAKIDANMREDPIDFDEVKEILAEHGFTGFYSEALKKLEDEA